MTEHISPELEAFREQWQAEVRSRQALSELSLSVDGSSSSSPRPLRAPASALHDLSWHDSVRRGILRQDESRQDIFRQGHVACDSDGDSYRPQSYDDPPAVQASTLYEEKTPRVPSKSEPVSALEHYEKAVEKETAGKLGDSLQLYRRAFRMDDEVDLKYRAKYFPRQGRKVASSASITAVKTATETSHVKAQSMNDLIESFSSTTIEPAESEVDGKTSSPCPMAALPDELLIHILKDAATQDVGNFVRLSQVCRRLAYLVHSEDQIWQRICLGTEFGFGGMHHYWQRRVTWGTLMSEDLVRKIGSNEDPVSAEERYRLEAEQNTTISFGLYRTVYKSSWQRMWRLRPRIRFNGCYICTVNYIRSGQANHNQITWNSPVHIVTYYRYLRFFRDGTVISLLTTSEPLDVIHYMTREAIALHAGGAAAHLPSVVMQAALRGRWKMPSMTPDAAISEAEGDVLVETEGVGKYTYRMDLALCTAGKGSVTRNNKLNWRGFYSYNAVTDDWAEFTRKNDKPFFFSRVKSYGVMGA